MSKLISPAVPRSTCSSRQASGAVHGGEELIGGEGLGQVLVGADPDAVDPVVLGVQGGDHDDRDQVRGPSPLQAVADLVAVDVGQHQVEQDQLGGLALDGLEDGLALEELDGAVSPGLGRGSPGGRWRRARRRRSARCAAWARGPRLGSRSVIGIVPRRRRDASTGRTGMRRRILALRSSGRGRPAKTGAGTSRTRSPPPSSPPLPESAAPARGSAGAFGPCGRGVDGEE